MKKLIKISILIFLLSNNNLKAQDSLNMSVLFHWDNNLLTSSSAYDNAYNEIWGYAADGREYAIIGTTEGTHFWDITDPANSVQVDFVAGAQQGLQVIHRDYHDYDGYLYMVCQEGMSTLQIADMSYLPDSVHVVYDSPEFFNGAHNIFIDTATAKLYAMDAKVTGVGLVGLKVFSLENPEAPQFIADYFIGTDVHDMFARNDTVYLNMGPMGLVNIYDFSDPLDPGIIGVISEYTFPGYNHSGYVNTEGNIYVMADETWGSPLKIIDITDFTDPQEVATVTSGVHPQSIAHNQLIHGDLMYSSYYYDGVYVWNIADPSNPYLAGFYDTSTIPHAQSYKGAWGVYPFLPSGNILVSDMQNGLFVLSLDETSGITENLPVGNVEVFPNPANDVLNLSYVSQSGYEQVRIFSSEGKLLLNLDITDLEHQIDISGLAAGFYSGFLSGKTRGTFKFVKL